MATPGSSAAMLSGVLRPSCSVARPSNSEAMPSGVARLLRLRGSEARLLRGEAKQLRGEAWRRDEAQLLWGVDGNGADALRNVRQRQRR